MNFCFYHMNQSTHSATHRVAIFVGQTLASGDLIRRPLKAPGGRVQRETIDEFEPFPLPFFQMKKEAVGQEIYLVAHWNNRTDLREPWRLFL